MSEWLRGLTEPMWGRCRADWCSPGLGKPPRLPDAMSSAQPPGQRLGEPPRRVPQASRPVEVAQAPSSAALVCSLACLPAGPL